MNNQEIIRNVSDSDNKSAKKTKQSDCVVEVVLTRMDNLKFLVKRFQVGNSKTLDRLLIRQTSPVRSRSSIRVRGPVVTGRCVKQDSSKQESLNVAAGAYN